MVMPALLLTLSKIRFELSPVNVNRKIAAWSVGAMSVFSPFSNVTPQWYGLATSLEWRNGSPRALRLASGVPEAAEGITSNVWRSPIHGLGSWLASNAWMTGRFDALLACWYSYVQLSDPALVIGTQKLKPCGTAVAGMLFPREKLPLEFVPRVVTTQSDRCDGRWCTGLPSTLTSSIQPPKSAGPFGLSYATRI